MKTELKSLSESLKNLTKYPDRPIVDYWRTVQGTNVGFHGDPKKGAGIPIAGPPVLTGGSASNNPLLKPLLVKYPKKTFIGDAIRKPNFPLSTINFIENFVGGDEKAIKARFAEMEKRISGMVISKAVKEKAAKENEDAVSHFVGKTVVGNDGLSRQIKSLGYENPIKYDPWLPVGKRFFVAYEFNKNQELQDYVKKLNDEKVGEPVSDGKSTLKDLDKDAYSAIYQKLLAKSPQYRIDESDSDGPASMLNGHFGSPSGNASYLYKIMQLEGVAGTFAGGEYATKNSVSTKEGMDEYMKESNNTDYEKCKQFLGDLYVLNQLMMRERKKKTQKVTRGMGNAIAGLAGMHESMKVVTELEKQGVSMRFVNRTVSGFASGGTSKFKGWTVNADIPAEAMLSSTFGAKIQGGQYAGEKEVLIIGASSLAFAPEQITYVSGSSVYTSKEVAAKTDSGKTYLY
jgi:hypothetical protein